MAGATAALVPDAATCFVGLARDPVTQLPRLYLNALPQPLGERTVLVLDPMLASGRSVVSCCELVVERGGRDIVVVCAIAAREGLQLLERSGLPIRILTAAIDEKLNADGYVVPGMGDAGDRQFDEGSAAGTGVVAVEGPLVADDGQQVRPPGYPTEFGAGLR